MDAEGLRVVVTGATGNVGTSVMRALAADPAVRSLVGVARRRPVDLEVDKATWVGADVVSDRLEPVLDGADAVVHLAWLIQPSRRLDVLWRTNVVGTRRLLDAVAATGVGALVYASSVGAYSPAPDDQTVDEAWPTDGVPQLSYSREKAYVERLLDLFEVEHPAVRLVRMRPGLMFKAEAASEIRRLFLGPLFPNQLARSTLTKVVERLPTRFQVLHTDDAADGFRRAVVNDVDGAFNLAADPVLGGATGPPLVERLVVGAATAAWRARMDPVDPAWVNLAFAAPVMDTTRAHTELDWWPQRSSTEVVQDLLAGLRDEEGAGTEPLAPGSDGTLRAGEWASGVGSGKP